MSEDAKRIRNGGPSLANMLTVLFVWLKLTSQIHWSWWWVTAPYWGGVLLLTIYNKVRGIDE